MWFNKIFLSKIVDFFVGNGSFRLIAKLVDRLIEIKIVVSGSTNLFYDTSYYINQITSIHHIDVTLQLVCAQKNAYASEL